jgi:hypothetical protein
MPRRVSVTRFTGKVRHPDGAAAFVPAAGQGHWWIVLADDLVDYFGVLLGGQLVGVNAIKAGAGGLINLAVH